MEQQDTTTQQNKSQCTEDSTDEVTTPLSTWWGGWVSQAKEKVSILLWINPTHQEF